MPGFIGLFERNSLEMTFLRTGITDFLFEGVLLAVLRAFFMFFESGLVWGGVVE